MTDETVPPSDGWAKMLAQATLTFLAVLAGGVLSYLGASAVQGEQVSAQQHEASRVARVQAYTVFASATSDAQEAVSEVADCYRSNGISAFTQPYAGFDKAKAACGAELEKLKATSRDLEAGYVQMIVYASEPAYTLSNLVFAKLLRGKTDLERNGRLSDGWGAELGPLLQDFRKTMCRELAPTPRAACLS